MRHEPQHGVHNPELLPPPPAISLAREANRHGQVERSRHGNTTVPATSAWAVSVERRRVKNMDPIPVPAVRVLSSIHPLLFD